MNSKYYLVKRILKKKDSGTTSIVESLIDGQILVMKKIYGVSSREASILASLPLHPNVVEIKRWFIEDSSVLVILMEACNGGDLHEWAKSHQPDQATIMEIAKQLIGALAHIHHNGIIHRDIKPKNILVHNQVFKLGDFGVARHLLEGSMAETAVGTPFYLCPEICSGSQYDYKSDVWSLGCVLYELAVGKRPFEGSSLKQVINSILYSSAPKLVRFPELNGLLERMLEKDPLKRFSAQVLCDWINGKEFDMKSEYRELEEMIGSSRLNNFFSWVLLGRKHQEGDNLLELWVKIHNVDVKAESFEHQFDDIKAPQSSSSQIFAKILQLRKMADIPEGELEEVIKIMQNYSLEKWETRFIEIFGSAKHQRFNQKGTYQICYQIMILEKICFN